MYIVISALLGSLVTILFLTYRKLIEFVDEVKSLNDILEERSNLWK